MGAFWSPPFALHLVPRLCELAVAVQELVDALPTAQEELQALALYGGTLWSQGQRDWVVSHGSSLSQQVDEWSVQDSDSKQPPFFTGHQAVTQKYVMETPHPVDTMRTFTYTKDFDGATSVVAIVDPQTRLSSVGCLELIGWFAPPLQPSSFPFSWVFFLNGVRSFGRAGRKQESASCLYVSITQAFLSL